MAYSNSENGTPAEVVMCVLYLLPTGIYRR